MLQISVLIATGSHGAQQTAPVHFHWELFAANDTLHTPGMSATRGSPFVSIPIRHAKAVVGAAALGKLRLGVAHRGRRDRGDVRAVRRQPLRRGQGPRVEGILEACPIRSQKADVDDERGQRHQERDDESEQDDDLAVFAFSARPTRPQRHRMDPPASVSYSSMKVTVADIGMAVPNVSGQIIR